MKYKRTNGILVKAPIRMPRNNKGEITCKLYLYNDFISYEKPLKAEGDIADEAIKELSVGDYVDAICHESKNYYIIDLFLRKGKHKKGA